MKLDPREARAVLRLCDFAALATHSAGLPGFPFASHAPFALDGACRPLLLLSNLAEHTRNVTLDARASLMATAPGPEPQERARITLVGEIRPAEPAPALVERYLRYHPEAATFLGFGDFRFYRLAVQRVRLIGGFARAGWIEAADWGLRPLDEALEAALLAALAGAVPAGWHLLGLDREGVDLRDGEGVRLRRGWDDSPADEAALATLAHHAVACAGTP
jgi:hypothetical protein